MICTIWWQCEMCKHDQTWVSVCFCVAFGQEATRQNSGVAHKPYYPLAKRQLGRHDCASAERSRCINKQNLCTFPNYEFLLCSHCLSSHSLDSSWHLGFDSGSLQLSFTVEKQTSLIIAERASVIYKNKLGPQSRNPKCCVATIELLDEFPLYCE